MKFYNREKEIEAVKNLLKLSEKHAHMLVVMGRRRVGKTRLIKDTAGGIYFFVDKKSSGLLLKEFSESLGTGLGIFVPEFVNWDDLIRYIFEYSRKKHIVVVFDEFQNFRYVDPSVFSIFQKHWDAYSASSRMLLVFIGSYVGLMKKIFTEEKEPLYGRITARIDLKPLKYEFTREICRKLGIIDEEDIVKLYITFGGIPRYYQLMEEYGLSDYDKTLKMLIFDENAVLRDEARQILVGELGRNYTIYFSILEAVSFGKNTLKEISDFTGVEMKSLGKYLGELIRDFDLVERRTPVIGGEKMGRYILKDNMIKFWFRFVHPNTSFIEMGRNELVLKRVKEEMPNYMGKAVEDVVREMLAQKLPFEPTSIGSWWNRKGDEIDLVALNERTEEIVFGEIKWTERSTGKEVIEELFEKKEMVEWRKERRREYYMLFSKKGFTKGAQEMMREMGVMRFELRDMGCTL
ncbi:MAG: ATP-binding protein [Candidatus Methanoperedens sp.]|nr:ATP-binding protein [Candidatus Methanoperedens sp.]